ncbi:hypothetical protein D3C73_1314880 [compost metagenome]
MEMTQQGAHLGIRGEIDEGGVAAGDEQAGIALGTSLQHLLQGQHLAGGEQAIHHRCDAPHLLLATAEVLGVDGTLVGLGPVSFRGHQSQVIARVQQGGGGHS